MKRTGKLINILVGTDFSRNANLAAHFAAEIARHEQARLIIFHAFYPFFVWDEASSTPTGLAAVESGLFPKEEEGELTCLDPESQAQKKMDTLAGDLYQQFGISVTRLIKPGFAADEIPALVQSLEVGLVVMGARGTGFEENKLFGEASSDLLATSTFPLLCIPPDFSGSMRDRITLLLQQKSAYGNAAGLRLLSELVKEWDKVQQPVQKAG